MSSNKNCRLNLKNRISLYADDVPKYPRVTEKKMQLYLFFFHVLTWRGAQRWRRCERCGSLSASACIWQTEQNGLTLGREPFVCGTDAEQTLHSRCVDVEASGRRYAVIKNSVIACGLLPPLYMFLLFLFSPWKWSLAPLLPSVQCGTDSVSLRGDNVNPHRLIATVSVEVSVCVFLAV